jgi:menaquinone-specific isochorismate synthase
VTIVERPGPLEAIEAIVGGLEDLSRDGPTRSGDDVLISATRPIPAIDPIDLFAAARDQDLEVALWLQPSAERSFIGIGRAWAIEPDGPTRFLEARSAWRAVLSDAIDADDGQEGPTRGPTLIGGLGFSGRHPAPNDPWAPFGSASLVVPTFGVTGRGTRSSLTVAIGPAGSDPQDPGSLGLAGLADRWGRLTQEAASAGRRRVETSTDASPDVDVSFPGKLRVADERPDRPAWDRTVGLFAGAVGRGRIDKVVLARRVVFEAAVDLDVIAALRHLSRTAPESTTFAFFRGGSTFLGATPERLVRTHGRSFETVAIAGSIARGADPVEDARLAAALLASEKDREEHEVVVDMLRRSLRPLVDSLDVADTPAVLPLRHLQHLMTPITGTTRDEADLLSLVGTLHPTPAVGGAPRDVALAMIDEHEAFDRGWYAGPVGWLGADGDGETMVALRCGLVAGRTATLFAGCGIMADSDPAREWEESRLKFRTMIAALGGITERAR